MKKILIFGGTTEGRIIAQTLSKSGIFCDVRVATEYGQQVMEETENLKVTVGRLTETEMAELCSKGGFSAVIDGTHPFARIVSENIKSAAGSLPLLRFERQTSENFSDVRFFDTTEECIQALKIEAGRIMLTTGSKELSRYCDSAELRQRLVARVLPGMESLKLCYDAGLEGNQIIAMQGPFSKEMNVIQLKDYGISVLVTKESGKTGGVDEKIQAAREAGVKVFVIKNPNCVKSGEGEKICNASENSGSSSTTCSTIAGGEYHVFRDFSSLFAEIEKICGVKLQTGCHIKITLAGIGPGSAEQMTAAVQAAIRNSDYIFGAERMISGIVTAAKKQPFYLAKDILPAVRQIQAENAGEASVTVLFSGDTGFFSGQEKLRKELKVLENTEIKVLPGLSSIQVLAAKTGISWQNAVIISMHGVSDEKWLPEFKNSVLEQKKLFLLTSGAEDVQKIGALLMELGAEKDYKITAGFNLSYADEEILYLDAKSACKITEKGLYSVFLVPENEI